LYISIKLSDFKTFVGMFVHTTQATSWQQTLKLRDTLCRKRA
jgi:hypothetical protein